MNPRALAISVLARVEATDAYLNRVLEDQLESAPALAPRDAGFATELCYGATRRRMALDQAVRACSDRRLETLEDRVLAALRVGAYQMFFMRVPARAAVAETVEALKELKLARATGFVNAVLRKLSARSELPLPPPEPWAEHLSVKESHPLWLVKRWEQRLGREKTQAMLAADNLAPAVTLRAHTARISRDELVTELRAGGIDANPTPVSVNGVTLPSLGRLGDLWGYREGLWQVQDEAAQLVVGRAPLPPGARVWDVCAAPGGKACQLAEKHEVLATDLHAHKLTRIQTEAKRLGVEGRVRTLAHDATTPLPNGLGPFDAVLLDAPCSGLGTLRRHPELRYRRAEADVARLAELQARLLEQVLVQLKPGGILIYAVCSTELEEGRSQIQRLLGAHPELSGIGEGPLVETFPGPERWDGFFASALRTS